MGRAPCCDKANVKKGPWSPEEDAKLKEYIEKHGTGGNWIALPQKVGLKRCGKSCRLRWLNYLRPNIKHGEFSEAEDKVICTLFATIGSRWSIIAAQLPGRTDNDIKNYWNTKLKKKLLLNMPQSSSTQYPKNYRPNINQPTTLCPLLSSSNYSLQQISSSNMPFPYNDIHCDNTNFRAFSRVYHHQDPMSPTFTPLISPNSTSAAHDGIILSPFHGNYDQRDGKNNNNNLSCSSSDGSSITNQISPDNYNYHQDLCFQSYLSNGVDESQKFLFGTSDHHGYSSSSGAVNGCFSDQNPLDYSSIEEIKQLISTNNNNNLNFLVDEIKTEGNVFD